MNRNRGVLRTGLALILLAPALSAQPPAPAPAPPGEGTAAHELGHLKQLTDLVERIAPTKEARAELYRRMQGRIRAALAPVISDPNLPRDTRSAARRAADKKEFAGVVSELGANLRSDSLTSSLRRAIEDILVTTQQVLMLAYPAFAVSAPAAGSTGMTRVQACGFTAGDASVLAGKLAENAAKLRTLADSVGRVELQIDGGTPALVGTAFVINQSKGLVATACHVVDDIAELPSGSATWTLPASKFTQNGHSAKILLDFGEMDAHDPQREYAVTGVQYVPSFQGCDGALLRVDTTAKPLPPQLISAQAEPHIPTPLQLDVFSIGYPSRDLSTATGDTKRYFGCVRTQSGTTAKFLFAGDVLSDEFTGAYHILAHVVPTNSGQSGSPLFDATDLANPRVIGIHICCVENAHAQTGNPCQWRDEAALQEAISIVDVLKLYQASLGAL
jgi:hypothetical protein